VSASLRRGLTVGALIVAAVAMPAPGQSADEAAVRAVVETYMHGLKFNDVPSFQRVFWPDAKLLWRDRAGHLGQLTQADWYRGFAQVAGQEEQGTLRIAALEVYRDIASVKVIEDYPTSRYTNYLSLVNFDGAWKIVNKVYTSERR